MDINQQVHRELFQRLRELAHRYESQKNLNEATGYLDTASRREWQRALPASAAVVVVVSNPSKAPLSARSE